MPKSPVAGSREKADLDWPAVPIVEKAAPTPGVAFVKCTLTMAERDFGEGNHRQHGVHTAWAADSNRPPVRRRKCPRAAQPLSQTNGFFLSAIVFLCKYTVDGQVELCYNKSTIGTGSGGGEEDARRIKKRNLLPFSFPCSVTVFLLFQRCRFLLCFQEKRSKRGVPPGAAGRAAPVGCGDENK